MGKVKSTISAVLKEAGGVLKLAAGIYGLNCSSNTDVYRLPPPYASLGNLGLAILTILSLYSIGSGVKDLAK
jgi:hypothetical protein